MAGHQRNISSNSFSHIHQNEHSVININKKKHVRSQFHPYPHPIPLKWRVSSLACGLCAGCNQSCQISTRSVQGVWSPSGWKKLLSPIDWRYRPYNSVCTDVLHCDKTFVIVYLYMFFVRFYVSSKLQQNNFGGVLKATLLNINIHT